MKQLRKGFYIHWDEIFKSGMGHLSPDTWIVLEYLKTWHSMVHRNKNVHTVEQNGKFYVWIKYATLRFDLPFLPKSSQGLRKFFNRLIEHKLIETVTPDRKKVYFRLTTLGYKICGITDILAEKNDSSLPQYDETPVSPNGKYDETPVSPKKLRCNSSFTYDETPVSPDTLLYNNRQNKDRQTTAVADTPALSFDFLKKCQDDIDDIEAYKKILSSRAHGLKSFLQQYCEEIEKMSKPFSLTEIAKILHDFELEEIKEVLSAMENFKALRKKYNSAYLTFLNWAKFRGILPKSKRSEVA